MFGAAGQVTGDWNFTQTTTGDFNADGKTDLIAKDGRGDLYLWRGNGDGTFHSRELLSHDWAFTQTTSGAYRGPGRDHLIARSDATGDLDQWQSFGTTQLSRPVRLTDGW